MSGGQRLTISYALIEGAKIIIAEGYFTFLNMQRGISLITAKEMYFCARGKQTHLAPFLCAHGNEATWRGCLPRPVLSSSRSTCDSVDRLRSFFVNLFSDQNS